MLKYRRVHHLHAEQSTAVISEQERFDYGNRSPTTPSITKRLAREKPTDRQVCRIDVDEKEDS